MLLSQTLSKTSGILALSVCTMFVNIGIEKVEAAEKGERNEKIYAASSVCVPQDRLSNNNYEYQSGGTLAVTGIDGKFGSYLKVICSFMQDQVNSMNGLRQVHVAYTDNNSNKDMSCQLSARTATGTLKALSSKQYSVGTGRKDMYWWKPFTSQQYLYYTLDCRVPRAKDGITALDPDKVSMIHSIVIEEDD